MKNYSKSKNKNIIFRRVNGRLIPINVSKMQGRSEKSLRSRLSKQKNMMANEYGQSKGRVSGLITASSAIASTIVGRTVVEKLAAFAVGGIAGSIIGEKVGKKVAKSQIENNKKRIQTTKAMINFSKKRKY